MIDAGRAAAAQPQQPGAGPTPRAREVAACRGPRRTRVTFLICVLYVYSSNNMHSTQQHRREAAARQARGRAGAGHWAVAAAAAVELQLYQVQLCSPTVQLYVGSYSQHLYTTTVTRREPI